MDSEGGSGSPSAAEVAAALSNPDSNMGSMNFQFDYIAYDGYIPGADDAEAWRMLWQPSLPYSISESTNLFIRPAIPVIFSQDVPQQGGGFSSEGVDLGDISFDASPTFSYNMRQAAATSGHSRWVSERPRLHS